MRSTPTTTQRKIIAATTPTTTPVTDLASLASYSGATWLRVELGLGLGLGKGLGLGLGLGLGSGSGLGLGLVVLLGASEEEHVAADAHRRVARAGPRIGARGVRLSRDGGR